MRVRVRVVALVAVAVVAGLGSAGCDTVKSDFSNLCNAEERSGSMGKSPEDYANAMRWADRAVKSQEVRGVMGKLGAMSPADKATYLRAEAAKAGVSPCPLADSWSGAR